MKVSVFTLFPEYFDSPLKASIVGRAIQNNTLVVKCIGLREYGEGNYRAADDRPFGGGEGMVLKPTVFEKALEESFGADIVEKEVQSFKSEHSGKYPERLFVYLSPQGKVLDSKLAKKLAGEVKELVLLCGHYEGIDERIIETFFHEEISIGDYVLTGGETAALVVIDSLSRFLPGVVGTAESVSKDTFEDDGLLKHPVYTRPAQWRGREVPPVLLSGNHQEIEKWRKEARLERTKKRRPDLLGKKS